jgi:hypothetical protein
MAVSGIVALHAGPTTMTVPVATSNQVVQGLSLGASGHYTSLQATIPVGVGLALAGTAGQLVDAIARSRLAQLISANAHRPEGTYFFSADFNVTPLVLGLVLVLVAGVFQLGRRLQKDTEGLV